MGDCGTTGLDGSEGNEMHTHEQLQHAERFLRASRAASEAQEADPEIHTSWYDLVLACPGNWAEAKVQARRVVQYVERTRQTVRP